MGISVARTWSFECTDKTPPARGAAGFKPNLSSSLLHFLPKPFPTRESLCKIPLLLINQGRCPCGAPSTARKLWNLPLFQAGCFLGILGCCTAQHSLTSGRTRICPHFPAAGSDPLYLLSARCPLARGWGDVPARAWERGALICRCLRSQVRL